MAETEYLLVDGYNIIFVWPELSKLAEENLEAARARLTDILCNYQGWKQCELILVFDGYKTKGSPGSVETHHNIEIVYTKEAQTADQFIELATRQLGRRRRIRVATSDGLEQIIVLGGGAERISAREFREEVRKGEQEIEKHLEANRRKSRNNLIDNVSPEMAQFLAELRLKEDE